MSSQPSARDPLTGITSMSMRDVLAELVVMYQARSGRRVDVQAAGGVDAARRIEAGEPFDFVVLASDAIDRLEASGRIERGSRVDLARSDVAIAIAAGTPRPEIGTEADVRNAVLSARSVGYSTGPSGAHLVRLFERWGIADTIASRVVQAQPGVPVGLLVARGEVELGFQQLSELIDQPGVEVIGALPREIQVETVFSAAICVDSARREEAQALLLFLASAQANKAKRRRGMKPIVADEPLPMLAGSSAAR